MSVQPTSLKVYIEKVLPHIGRKQREVLRLFLAYPTRDFTNMEASYRLGWSINRVTPRTLELRKKGLLELSQRRRCTITGNMAYAWRLTK